MKRVGTTACMLAASLFSANAQNTTSSITGVSSDSEGVLPGTIVRVTHVESGTTYSTVSNSKGIYRIDGILPGGPYTVEFSFVGYQKSQTQVERISLGEVYSCNATLKAGAIKEVVIVGDGASIRKTGASESITAQDIEKTPSIERWMDDLTNLSPYFQGNGFGGRDNGTINYSIDGSNFNNNMGFERVRMPAQNRPISIDAIEEMQIVTSSFDVKNSNFLSASVNAVTKRGSNTFKGSAYTYIKSENFRGNKPYGEDLGDRPHYRRNIYGVTLGGPIIKDKLFFFVNGELEDIPNPIHNWKLSSDGIADPDHSVSRVTAADMAQFANDLKSMYGWNPGSYTDFDGENNYYRLLGRLDWNISDKHHAMVRYNYTGKNLSNNVYAGALGLGHPVSQYSQTFRGSTWTQVDNVHSIAFELNSNFNSLMHNELRGSYTWNSSNNRDCDAKFPTIDIMKEDQDGVLRPFMNAGIDQYAWNNGIKENVWNIVDNFSMSLGQHHLTLGAEFEAIKAYNCFMKFGGGYWRYNSYEDFLNKKAPSAFAMCWSLTGEETAKSDIDMNRLAFYAQDEFDVSKRLRLLYGMRVDMNMYVNDKYANPAMKDVTFNGTNVNWGEWPKTTPLISPRFGFNYDVVEDGSVRLRGGIGLYTGRFPLIFYSKMQENSGMLQTSVQINKADDPLLQYLAGGIRTPQQVLSEIVPNLPEDLQKRFPTQAGATSNVIGIDRDFKTPQTLKTTLAIDWKLPLPFDALFTLEGTYAKDYNAITAYDANIDMENVEAKRFGGNDDRFCYIRNKGESFRIDPSKGFAYVMTNVNKGYSANVVARLTMTPIKNLDIMAAYTFTKSKSINSMVSYQVDASMKSLPTVNGCNYQEVSNPRYFIAPHRIIASASYKFEYLKGHASTMLSLFYEGRAWNPNTYAYYSFTYANDMNGDGFNNDLLYVPATKDELLFADITNKDGSIAFSADEQREAFWKYVNDDHYLKTRKGKYSEAFGGHSQWGNRFNLRIAQEFKVKAGKNTNRLQINCDIFNVANLLNNKWGVLKYQQNVTPLKRVGVDADNVPIYQMSTFTDPDDKQVKLVDSKFRPWINQNQCWQLQLGIKYLFN